MTRPTAILALLLIGVVPAARCQRLDSRQPSAVRVDSRRLTADGSLRRAVPHYGKWLTAAGAAALTVLGAEQHRLSRRDWDALLTICRSAEDACALGPDGRYVRGDAEALYQRSRLYDRRANRWLLGAQATLLATAALFIIDLHPGEGPENIPFPAQIRVGALPDGARVGLELRF